MGGQNSKEDFGGLDGEKKKKKRGGIMNCQCGKGRDDNDEVEEDEAAAEVVVVPDLVDCAVRARTAATPNPARFACSQDVLNAQRAVPSIAIRATFLPRLHIREAHQLGRWRWQ